MPKKMKIKILQSCVSFQIIPPFKNPFRITIPKTNVSQIHNIDESYGAWQWYWLMNFTSGYIQEWLRYHEFVPSLKFFFILNTALDF